MYKTIGDAIKKGGLNIAHRGARDLSPENTLVSARRAMDSGAHMLEIDVRLSRDGHLVVVHDATLDRTSDVKEKFPDRFPWQVKDFTLDDLKSLDFGSWFIRDDPFGTIASGRLPAAELKALRGIQVPTLEEVLLFVIEHKWLVNVEIKDLMGLSGHIAIAEKTVALINSMGARDRVLISSFNHDYLVEVKRYDTNILTGALVASPPSDVIEMMRRIGASTYNPGLRAYRPRGVKKLKEHGYAVLVWVVNSRKIARLLFRGGVDGVFTDYPGRMHDAMLRST